MYFFQSIDKEEIESAAKALMDTIQPIGAKLYEPAETPEDSESDSKDDKKKSKADDAVEGEVVDEDKK